MNILFSKKKSRREKRKQEKKKKKVIIGINGGVQWLECVLEGTYAELEPLFEDIASQHISDPTQSATVTKLLHRLKLNAAHHPKHPSSSVCALHGSFGVIY